MVRRISGFLQTSDGRVETLWFHPESGIGETALILLHEGLGCNALWRNFPQHLAHRTGCDVFSYSRLGYGGSDPCTLPRPLTYMHDEAERNLPEVLDSISSPSLILIGHSDGASIASIHAGSRPDPRVRGIVLIAPHFLVENVSLDSIRSARKEYDHGNLRDRLVYYHGENVDCAFRGWNDAWLDPGFLDWNLTEYLSGIRVPVLFIQGKEDPYGTLHQLTILADHLQGVLVERIIEFSRHSPHLEQPESTLDSIGQFIRSHCS